MRIAGPFAALVALFLANPAHAVQLGAIEIIPGKICRFTAPLSAEEQRYLALDPNPSVKEAHAAIAVPAGFDPAKRWPVLIVSATSDGSGLNVPWLPFYREPALAHGWVILAADGPIPPPKDNRSWRFAMLRAALDEMRRDWPASRDWPLACGGFSGGSKWSALMAGLLMAHGQGQICGIFMGGCNEDKATIALELYKPDPVKFKAVPIYISSGASDPIATPVAAGRVQARLTSTGFRNVILEEHNGGHELYTPHVTKALQFFEGAANLH